MLDIKIIRKYLKLLEIYLKFSPIRLTELE